MQVLVIGTGGREHALCDAFSNGSRVSKVFCASGNAGIADVAECIQIEPTRIQELAVVAQNRQIDLTFVGGETPLAMGIVDEFEKRNLRIIGPTASAARLESSKTFAKEFMARHHVPTARFVATTSVKEAVLALNDAQFGGPETPVVVKADGLAAGKGVVVAQNRADAITAIEKMASLVGVDAAGRIVLEECLFGREVSMLMFADGEDFSLMPPTRDHKRIGDGDTGPNTGGMGTITDSSLLSDDETREIVETIVKPTLRGCIDEGIPFRGILFLGLMMSNPGRNASANEHAPSVPMLLEYNVRFGDPETQSILVRLETDLVDICEAMLDGKLSEIDIRWKDGNSACVVLAADGYPQKPRTGDVISGIEKVATTGNVKVFHSGTARNDKGELITSGGRVLGVTSWADNLTGALELTYDTVSKISWDGINYRKDIGK